MLHKTAVVIPAYNASQTLPDLIRRVSVHLPQKNIIVVDDGSRDQTSQAVEETEATLLHHPENRGKGEALKTGFQHAVGKGYDLVITLDSDLQHDPRFIEDFLSRVRLNNADLILGRRNINVKTMPLTRYLSNKLTSSVISILTGRSIKDSQSGYRLIKSKVLRSLKLRSRKYDLESEILLKAAKKRFKIGSIPVSTIYVHNRGFASPLANTLRFLLLVWRSLWW